MQDFIARAVGLAGIFKDVLKGFVKALSCMVITEEARRSRKGQGVGNDVERIAAVQAADGEGQAFLRRDDSHAKGLEIAVDIVEAVDRALGQVGAGAVAAVAVDADFKAKAAGHGSFVADGDFPCRNIPTDVGGIAGVYLPGAILFEIAQKVFEGPRCFFTPFKHEEDCAVPLIFPAM